MSDLIIQNVPAVQGRINALFLCFHGVGSNAEDLRPLAGVIANRHPQAWVVSVRSPHPSDLGGGWQWFSVRGVTEVNRPQRVAAAMPAFVQAVTSWQQRSGSDAAHTTLVGFSKGAIMALEATQLPEPLASRVVAMAGRFANPPTHRPAHTRIHLLHGASDGIMPAQSAVDAQTQLAALQAQVTLDLFPGLGHGIDGRMLERLGEHLATP